MSDFEGKVILITGASSGIGAQTAEDLARLGAKLALTGRHQERLQATADRCRAAGTKEQDVLSVCGDLTQEADVERVMAAVIQHFNTIHILVNNAGGVVQGKFEAMSASDLDTMYHVNVRSVVMVTKKAMPHIIENKGSIVNISSISGNRPTYYCFAYAMMKAAVNQFTQCLALELAPKGVRVNAIAPGMIDTPIFIRPGGHIADTPEKLPEFYESAAACHPLGRVGTSAEVSQVIQFLTSGASSFMTGAILPLDGGRAITMASPALLLNK